MICDLYFVICIIYIIKTASYRKTSCLFLNQMSITVHNKKLIEFYKENNPQEDITLQTYEEKFPVRIVEPQKITFEEIKELQTKIKKKINK